MKRVLGSLFLILAMGLSVFAQTTNPPVSALTSHPTITITTGTADSSDFPTTGMHALIVEFDAGTVTGSFTTCTMQAKTLLNGTYFTIGSAVSVTVASSMHPTWVVQAPLATTVSTSAANDFGGRSKFTFACSGSYGTSIATPVLTVIATAVVPGSTVTGGTAVQVCASGLLICAPVDATNGLTVKSNITDEAVGAAVTNPPVGVGAIFETTPATIATGDRTALHSTTDQRLMVQDQGIGSSGNVPNENCDQSGVYDTNTNGKTQLVALSSGKITRVCGLTVTQSTTTDVTVSFGSGTGTNCGTTYTAKTPAWPIVQNSVAQLNGLSLSNSPIPYFATSASEELCVSTSAGVSVQILFVFSQR